MPSTRPTQDWARAHATPTVTSHPDIACRGERPEIFFPGSGQNGDAARAVCNRCPHRRECLDWALDTRQSFGVWGGMTAEERHHERKRRGIA